MGDWITRLQPGEVFVFGSNLAGIHGAGAALQAVKCFGAKYGVGEGLAGKSYAFPTLDKRLKKLPFERMEAARDTLYAACRENPDMRFLLTKVGCGLAGYPESEMSSLFTAAPANLILPDGWGPHVMPYIQRILRTGDLVRVRHEEGDEWCTALVAIASASGKSVALHLDGAVRAGKGIIVGVLPLNIDYDARTVTSLIGDEYEIDLIEEQS